MGAPHRPPLDSLSRGRVGQHFYTDGHDVTYFAFIDLEYWTGALSIKKPWSSREMII